MSGSFFSSLLVLVMLLNFYCISASRIRSLIQGVSLQGVVLILLLGLIAFSAWRGLENIQEGVNGWTRASLALVWTTLLFAALAIRPGDGVLSIGITGKFFGVGLSLAVIHVIAWQYLPREALQDWL